MNLEFKKFSGLLLLLFIVTLINGQDTIITKTGSKIPVRIVEIKKDKVLYQINESGKGAIHSVRSDMILSIIYKNGEIRTYSNFMLQTPILNTYQKNDSLELFNKSRYTLLTRKGNKVFIDNVEDMGILNCAIFELSSWGYWNIIKEKQGADFILRFNCRFGMMSGKGFAEFIDPLNYKVIYKTEHYRAIVISFNSKRGFIKRMIKNKIIPLYK